MALVGVESVLKALVATGYNGYAVSEPVFQDEGEADFVSLVNISAKYEFANISTAIGPDALMTNVAIANGDNLIIVKEDDTIHEVIVSGAIAHIDTYGLIPIIQDDYTGEYGTISASNEHSSYPPYLTLTDVDPYNCFITDGNVNTDLSIVYEFNSPRKITKIMIGAPDNNFDRCPKNIEFFVSDNNLNWLSLGTYTALLPTENYEEQEFVIPVPILGKYLKTFIYDNYGDSSFIEVGRMKYYEEVIEYEMDTTLTTQGEIPSRVYAVDSKLSFYDGNQYSEAIENSNTYSGISLPTLELVRTYIDLSIAGILVRTRIDFRNIGDKCVEVVADLWKDD